MKHFLVSFDFTGDNDHNLFFEVLKSLNFTLKIFPNVWITCGNGVCQDAKSIYNLLSRYAKPSDVVFVSQMAPNVSMETFHGNISRNSLRELISV